MEWGIDVSRWQGNFNFANAKKEGITFAILKAGGGDAGLYKDGKFDRNYAECSRLGIPVGAYFFGEAMTTNQAMKEAEYFCKLLQGKSFPVKVWYDVEAKMLGAANLSTIVLTFIERVRAAGYDCGIYASESTIKTLRSKNTAIDRYPHWVARWTKTPPTVPTDIWQFGGETNLIRSNKVAGQTCDQNYCYFDFTGQTSDNAPVVIETPTAPTKEEYDMPTIKKGSKGKAVKIWQIIIGATPDGVFGPITEANTRKWQSQHLDANGNKLVADGIVGPKTWKVGLDSV